VAVSIYWGGSASVPVGDKIEKRMCVRVFLCVFAGGTNEPTNQRTNQKNAVNLTTQFICRGGTPYGPLGFIPQFVVFSFC
jgi:hypothetical protein